MKKLRCSSRCAALLLALALVFGGFRPMALAAPARVAFDELEAGTIDLAALRTLTAQTLSLAQSAENAGAVLGKVLEMDAWLTGALTTYTMDMIAYYRDTGTASGAAYRAASADYASGSAMIFDCLRALLDTPCADVVYAVMTEESLTALLAGDSDRLMALSSITDRYTERYNTVISGAYDSYEEQAEAVGTLYLELVGELKQAAGGGEEAVRLYYEAYGRDGSFETYEPLRKAVREQIAPMLLELWLLCSDVETAPESGEAALDAVVRTAEAHFPDVAEAARYMVDFGYYDVTPGAKKFDAGFTTYLYLYEAPYLYYPTAGGFDGVAGLSHELGHFANYYNYGANADTDSAEVHSQGLELLYTLYYDELFQDSAVQAELLELTNILTAVVFGCLMDEFQYTAFTQTPESAAELQAIYQSLLADYGLGVTAQFPAWAYYWMWVPHSFSQPMYYLSYALSALPALEIWSIAQEDPDLALARYSDFVVLSNENGFALGLRGAGLSSPAEGAAVPAVTDELRTLARESGAWLYSDISECWGATEIQWFGLEGGVNGYADGTYRPDGTLTRAHVARVITNLFALESVEIDLTIVDVPDDYWAHDEIAFVLSIGAMSLDEAGEFHPNAPITRQEMAKIVCELLLANGIEADGSVSYTDAAGIDADCLEAVQMLAALDIMHGRADGSFNPNGILTRQELAVIFFRTFACLATA